MTTNVPALVITDQGVILPDDSAILAGVQADIDSAFGGGVDPSLQTPQGQIAQSETQIISDKNAQIAEVANQFNPDYASGRWQDALARIYFIDRISASGTVVSATCIGAVGTTIPARSVAQDTAGYLYSSLADAVIDATGEVTVQFQCQTTGSIACPIGSLSKIYSSVIGWDRVENNTAGVLGRDVETRTEFETRRRLSVAVNAVNTVESMRGALLSTNGVIDAYVIDNYTGAVVNTGATAYPVAANSIYAAVVGGASSDVANAIWSKLSPGCNMNGTTTYTVEDQTYADPKPQYVIKWVTPTSVPVSFAVSITNNPKLPANIATLVKNAILATFNGNDNRNSRASIASTIYVSRYYDGINETNPLLQVVSVLVGTGGTATLAYKTFGIDQSPTLDASNIAVTLV